QAVQGFRYSRAQREIFHDLLELAAQGLGSFFGQDCQATLNVVARAHRPGKQIDRVRKYLFNLTHAILAFDADIEERNERTRDRKHYFQNLKRKQAERVGYKVATR